MATIDDLIAQLQLPDEERKRIALSNLFLGIGTNLIGVRKGQEWQALGQGLQQGVASGQSAIDDARRQRMQGLQARGTAYDIANKESAYNDAELLLSQQKEFAKRFSGGLLGVDPSKLQGQTPILPPPHPSQAIPGNGDMSFGEAGNSRGGQGSAPPPSPYPTQGAPMPPQAASIMPGAAVGGPAGGVPSKREVAQRYQAYGDYWMSLGRSDKAQTYYEAAQKLIPQLKEQKTLTQNGRRVTVNVYTDGSHEILPDVGPDMEKAVQIDTGGMIGAADPFTLQPIPGGGRYNKTPTPDALLSSDTSRRNADMTDRRARELNDITRSGQGKPPPGYAWMPDGQSLRPISGGPHDTSAKDAQRQATIVERADIVIGKVDDALKQTNYSTAGALGAVRGMIPGTSAYDLRANVDTVKANLGFQELAAMREASPTGGALGQVAVRELELLQSTISSLDANQSPGQLRKSLGKVKTHYENWKRAVQEAHGGAPRRQQQGPSRGVTVDALEAEMRRRGIAP